MTDLEKEVIKVLIDINISPGAHLLPDGSGYQGISYDIWKLIREQLKHKYSFIEHFKVLNSADRVLLDVSNNIYDIVIAPMQQTLDRMKIINFTNVIMLNKQTILHLPNQTINSTFRLVRRKIILGPLLLTICTGIILGIILYWLEPTRFIMARSTKPLALRRTIVSSAAGFFNEKGFLSENSTMSAAGISMVIFIIIVAFFVTIIMQSLITENVINLQENTTYNTSNIKGKVILCLKGYASGKFMERYGAKIKYYDKPLIDIIDIYLKNKHKYIGVALEYYDALEKRHSSQMKLVISNSNFGISYIRWIVNKSKSQFLKDFNIALTKINFNFTKHLVCKKYLPQDSVYLCNI